MAVIQEAESRPSLPFAAEEMEEIRPCQIGMALRAARLASRRSIDEMAEQTCIRACYIEAMESGQLGSFAAPLYAIGFARNYARALGLDPAWAEQAMRDYAAATATSWRRSGWLS